MAYEFFATARPQLNALASDSNSTLKLHWFRYRSPRVLCHVVSSTPCLSCVPSIWGWQGDDEAHRFIDFLSHQSGQLEFSGVSKNLFYQAQWIHWQAGFSPTVTGCFYPEDYLKYIHTTSTGHMYLRARATNPPSPPEHRHQHLQPPPIDDLNLRKQLWYVTAEPLNHPCSLGCNYK